MAARGVLRIMALGLLAAVAPAAAAEKVGETVDVTVIVTGQAGALARGDAIHRDESIRTNASGVGAFRFDDGTKLAVGPNSTVVIDSYVYAGGGTARRLALGATKGALRWISGTSDHAAYRIVTPAGTLGVRGTAFDVYVGRSGVTAVTLLSGAVQFCGARGCASLTRRCDVIVVRPGGEVSRPRGVTRRIGLDVPAAQAFPFLAGRASLPRGYRAGTACAGLAGSLPTGNNGFGDLQTPDFSLPTPEPPRNRQ